MDLTEEQPLLCRDSWIPQLPYEAFKLFSCAKCFVQAFLGRKNLTLNFPLQYPYLLRDRNDPNVTYYPDPDAQSSSACAEHTEETECDAWRSCCQAATDCCLYEQQKSPTDAGSSCSATWDGVSCWPSTPEGVLRQQYCPDYYMAPELQWLHPQAQKSCSMSGQWALTEMKPGHYLEMTDYTQCYDTTRNTDILKVALYIDFAGNALSICFLAAAIILILATRTLRFELRTRTSLQLHFSLFLAMLSTSIFTVVFHYIYYNAITSPHDAIYRQNTVWCRVLHTFTKYFKTTSFLGMFCEGLYLFRKILHVMKIGHRESLLKYLIIGWGVPLVIVGTYVAVRIALKQNDRCWMDWDLNSLEFIVIVPSLLSLVCNLLFLISIQWMLCTKMRSDTSDKRIEVLRRALFATISLIPVFGLQFLFIIYKPRYWPPYEIIVALFTSTQGCLVAILYCFATKEVKEEVSSMCSKCCKNGRRRTGSGKSANNNLKPPSNSQNFLQQIRRLSCSSREQRTYHCKSHEEQVQTETLLLQDICARRSSSESRGTHETQVPDDTATSKWPNSRATGGSFSKQIHDVVTDRIPEVDIHVFTEDSQAEENDDVALNSTKQTDTGKADEQTERHTGPSY